MNGINYGFNVKDVIERPMSDEARIKYGSFIAQKEGEMLKLSDIGIIPVLDKYNKNVAIGWKLPIDDKNTKVERKEEKIDFGPYGSLLVKHEVWTNEYIDPITGKKTVSSHSAPISMDTITNVDILRSFYRLAEILMCEHEFVVRALSPEFRKIGHIVTDVDGSPQVGYAFLESYYGMTSSSDPKAMMDAQTRSDIMRLTKGNLKYLVTSKKTMLDKLAKSLSDKDNFENTVSSTSIQLDALVGSDSFNINDNDPLKTQAGGFVYNGMIQNSAGEVFSSQGMKPQFDTMILGTGNNNNSQQTMGSTIVSADGNVKKATIPVKK